MVRGHGPPAHADVPYGALRVLHLPLEGQGLPRLRPPCEKHRVKLRDRVGAEHILKADAGCRNTLFNSRAQTGAEYVTQLLALGVRRFRVEFVDEDAATVSRTLEKYQALLKGDIDGTALWNDLKVLNQLGVTRGTMRVRL